MHFWTGNHEKTATSHRIFFQKLKAKKTTLSLTKQNIHLQNTEKKGLVKCACVYEKMQSHLHS